VDSGVTTAVPEEGTLPTPWSIIKAVAADTFQSSTAGLPSATAVGVELNELITGKLGTALFQKQDVNKSGTTSNKRGTAREYFLNIMPDLLLTISFIIKLKHAGKGLCSTFRLVITAYKSN
jgi:hypothetical protein